MRWSTHALIGAAAGSVISSASGSDVATLVVLGGAFGILPDIDMLFSGLSRAAHRSPVTHSVLGAALFVMAWVLLCLLTERIGGIGQMTEVPLAASSATVFSSVFLHAAADTASVSGCRALYPFSSKRFRGPVRYDDWAANTAMMVVALGIVLAAAAVDLSVFP